MLDLDDVGKAASYPMDVLRFLTPDQLDRLSFLGFPERHGYNNLNLLFPQNARFGKLDPPASYLSSGARVREWRKISRGNQLHIIDQAENPPAPVSRGSSRRRSRGGRRGLGDGRPVDDAELAGATVSYEPEPPAFTNLLAAISAQTPGPGDTNEPTTLVTHPDYTPVHNQHHTSQLDQLTARPPVQSPSVGAKTCKGVDVKVISGEHDDATLLIRGFHHLVGNACRDMGHTISTKQQWDHGSDIVGFLRNPNSQDDEDYAWKCRKMSDNVWTFQRKDCKQFATIGNPLVNYLHTSCVRVGSHQAPAQPRSIFVAGVEWYGPSLLDSIIDSLAQPCCQLP